VTGLAERAAKKAGLDYKAVRAGHRATWKWTTGGKWYTQPWGVSVKGIGFDLTCKCGWESRTGGAIKARVEEMHEQHIFEWIVAIVENTGGAW
jgi:hypothetical protein